MKLSEFIEKYGDRKIDERELMETLHIKAKAWLPDVGEKHYFVSPAGRVLENVYYNISDPNKSVIEHNRVFQTREEAEFEAERQKFMLYMEREFARNSNPIDWGDTNQRKWYILCDISSTRHSLIDATIPPNVTLNSYIVLQTQGTLFTTNEYWLREFIEQHEDDIKRYCFGVETWQKSGKEMRNDRSI